MMGFPLTLILFGSAFFFFGVCSLPVGPMEQQSKGESDLALEGEGLRVMNNSRAERNVNNDDYELTIPVAENRRSSNEKQKHHHHGPIKGIKRKNDLQGDEGTPMGKKPHKCGKEFKLKSDLKRQERTHTGEKRFKCNNCSKEFTQNSHLKRHKLIHSRKFPFHCNECGRGFTQRYNLKVHKRAHTEETPYKCDACGIQYKIKSSLVNHKKKCTEVQHGSEDLKNKINDGNGHNEEWFKMLASMQRNNQKKRGKRQRENENTTANKKRKSTGPSGGGKPSQSVECEPSSQDLFGGCNLTISEDLLAKMVKETLSSYSELPVLDNNPCLEELN